MDWRKTLKVCQIFVMVKFIEFYSTHLELNQSTNKRQHFRTYLKAFFVQHSSEYENVG